MKKKFSLPKVKLKICPAPDFLVDTKDKDKPAHVEGLFWYDPDDGVSYIGIGTSIRMPYVLFHELLHLIAFHITEDEGINDLLDSKIDETRCLLCSEYLRCRKRRKNFKYEDDNC